MIGIAVGVTLLAFLVSDECAVAEGVAEVVAKSRPGCFMVRETEGDAVFVRVGVDDDDGEHERADAVSVVVLDCVATMTLQWLSSKMMMNAADQGIVLANFCFQSGESDF